ncbi:hypothetical protein [Luteolibacter sp. Populi]|uniref:hypothetical protein n=1 Tax=Luteolibacter sp. Populi TaxID=3230487 RepID=UPI003466E4D5
MFSFEQKERTMRQPYVSLDGLAFQPQADDFECRVNTRAALMALQEFVYGRGNIREAEEALRYLSGKYDKLTPFCQEFMRAFHYDEAADAEIIRRICTPAYNSIVRRLV